MGHDTQLERRAALEDGPRAGGGPVAPRPSSPAPARRPTASGDWRGTARAVLPAFVITRLLTLAAGVLGAALWGIHDAGDVYDPAGLTTGMGGVVDRLVAPYARWDAVWFLDIAERGYPTDYSPRTAFFPLYPVLLTVGGAVLGSPLIAGLAISTACAFAGAMVVHRLTELELGRPAADVAVWALLLFPGSLWLTAVYSEGLFLLLSSACLLCARERRWPAVAVLGALAAATRSAGVVLVVPVLVMALQQHREAGAAMPRPALVDRIRRLRGPLLAATGVLGGLLVFVVGLRLAGHPWTVSFDQQEQWGRRTVGPVEGVVESVRAGWTGLGRLVGTTDSAAPATPNASWMNPLLLVFLATGVAALIGAARRLPPAYAAYAGCALLLPLSAPAVAGGEPLMSLPRFLGVLFPLAMWTGWWLTRGPAQRVRRGALAIVGAGLLALVSELTARWLFVA